MHDPTLTRWKKQAVFGFAGTNLKIETIKNAAGRYQTAVFETDEIGRLRDLAIKFSKYHSSEEDATEFYESLVKGFIALQEKTSYFSIEDVYSDIESANLIPNHDGPRKFDFVRVPAGNTIVGHDIKVEENERG